MTSAPPGSGALTETTGPRTSSRSVPDAPDVEAYLRQLVGRCDDPPLISDLTAADIGTPRGTASIARAALAWLCDGRPDVIAERLRVELAEADRLAIWRTRQAWAEFEDAWREHRHGRPYYLSFAELDARRRRLATEPLPDDHPLAHRRPWTNAELGMW